MLPHKISILDIPITLTYFLNFFVNLKLFFFFFWTRSSGKGTFDSEGKTLTEIAEACPVFHFI